jgi:hypothetical protein
MKNLIRLLGVFALATAAFAQTNVSVPTGTPLKARLQTTLNTYSTKRGDAFTARVSEPVTLNGAVAIPEGSVIQGRVTRVSEPRRIQGRPTIGIAPETVTFPTGEKYQLDASLIDTDRGRGTDVDDEGRFKGAGHERGDTKELAVGVGGGMALGGVIGGGPGVLIGGAVGATAATAHWLSQHNSAILPSGTQLILELNRPLSLGAAMVAGQ